MASTRREVLRTGWKVGGACLAVAAGWTLFESLRPLSRGSKGAVLELGDPTNYPADTATFVTEGRLFVANAGGHLFALSPRCPHLGCRVPFCDSSGRFECPCHGSRFDLGGEWIQGPAPRGMASTNGPDAGDRVARSSGLANVISTSPARSPSASEIIPRTRSASSPGNTRMSRAMSTSSGMMFTFDPAVSIVGVIVVCVHE